MNVNYKCLVFRGRRRVLRTSFLRLIYLVIVGLSPAVALGLRIALLKTASQRLGLGPDLRRGLATRSKRLLLETHLCNENGPVSIVTAISEHRGVPLDAIHKHRHMRNATFAPGSFGFFKISQFQQRIKGFAYCSSQHDQV